MTQPDEIVQRILGQKRERCGFCDKPADWDWSTGRRVCRHCGFIDS